MKVQQVVVKIVKRDVTRRGVKVPILNARLEGGREEGRGLWRVVFPRGADDVGVIAGRART